MSSLRARLFAAMAAVAILSVALTVGVAQVLIHNRQSLQAERTLERQATALASVLTAAPGGRVYAVAVGAGKGLGGVRALAPARAARVLAALDPGRQTGRIVLGGRALLFAQEAGPTGDRIVLVRPAKLGRSDAVPLSLSLLGAALGGALLAGLLSLLAARRVTRPLAALEQAAARLPHDPAVRVEVAEPRELASLAAHFNEMAAELERARDGQRTFLLSVGHELKTPLTAIRGYAEGLLDGAVAAEQAAPVIKAETDRLERLVGDLLDLARLGQAEFRAERRPVDLAALAQRARQRFAAAAAERDVAIEIAASPGASALADHDRLLQVVSNLTENALRVTPPGGTITLTAEPGSFSVADSGPGIDPADLPHAFERFYLHRRAGGDGGRGSGLGLAIVAELAAAMGGRASVTSRPGQGARFRLELPRETE